MGRLETEQAAKRRPIMPLFLQVLLGIEMAAVIAAAFVYVPPAEGFQAPEAARIIIFHVPCAMIAVVAYVVSMVYAIGYLWKRNPASDVKSASSAGLGFVFTVLATVTGMIFARIQWGTAWNWDPRETSILALLIVYAAYFALRAAIPGSTNRARISAGYNILAGVVMPYLVFVLPRLAPGLHPSSTLTQRGGLSPEYRIVLLGAMAGYLALYVWMLRLSVRVGELQAERRKRRRA